MSDNRSKVVLVTGAAQRIGAAIATTLHRAGHRVLLHYRNSSSAALELAAALNDSRHDSACALRADFADDHAVTALAQNALQQWGAIDALINNASAYFPTPWGSANVADWHTLFDSNVRAPFFLTQALLPMLRARRGCVINLLDIHAERPEPNHPIYCMAKAALAMMTKSLALDLRGEVRVNGIAPGAILWPSQELLSEAEKSELLAKIPQRALGTPADIARTALFLLDDAPYINGQILAVDGGLSLR
jgi:pteridine reductase